MSTEREEAVLVALGPASPELTEVTEKVQMRDGYTSHMVVVKPSSAPPATGRPLLVLFHGGGFCMGSPKQIIPYARSFAQLFDAVCVCPAYRLAPEHKFPIAAQDAWDAFSWITANVSALGATASKGFIVGGVSAGGNLAAVLAQMAKEQQLEPKLTGQWLSIPVLLDPAVVPEKYKDMYLAWEQNSGKPGLNTEAMKAVFAHWEPDVHSPLYSPFNSPNTGAGMPPAYLQSCGMDPLRDDAFIYEKVLKEKGVKTRLDVYPGLPHGFWALFPQLKSGKKVAVDIALGMGWLLGKEVDPEEARKVMRLSAMA